MMLTEAQMTDPTSESAVSAVWEALHEVIDPEIGINIVDLGLVYGVRLDGDVALLDITLTSPACPLTDEIEGQVFVALDGVVADHVIEWVWMPPWSPASMTDAGKEQARAIGLAVP
jgi:metal-sulfur cluster biosynthetic enzyme